MKYTHYIVNGRPVRPEQLGRMGIPVALLGILVVGGLLPGAVLMDTGRYLKYRQILIKKERRKLNYIKCVLRSLDCGVTKENINLFKVA